MSGTNEDEHISIDDEIVVIQKAGTKGVDDTGDDDNTEEESRDRPDAMDDESSTRERSTIVTFMNQENSEELKYRVKPDTPISKIIATVSKKLQQKVILVFEGERLKGSELFRSVNYHEDGIIDILTEQTGGCSRTFGFSNQMRGSCDKMYCGCQFGNFCITDNKYHY